MGAARTIRRRHADPLTTVIKGSTASRCRFRVGAMKVPFALLQGEKLQKALISAVEMRSRGIPKRLMRLLLRRGTEWDQIQIGAPKRQTAARRHT
jgi:hypothetical protein